MLQVAHSEATVLVQLGNPKFLLNRRRSSPPVSAFKQDDRNYLGGFLEMKQEVIRGRGGGRGKRGALFEE